MVCLFLFYCAYIMVKGFLTIRILKGGVENGIKS